MNDVVNRTVLPRHVISEESDNEVYSTKVAYSSSFNILYQKHIKLSTKIKNVQSFVQCKG